MQTSVEQLHVLVAITEARKSECSDICFHSKWHLQSQELFIFVWQLVARSFASGRVRSTSLVRGKLWVAKALNNPALHEIWGFSFETSMWTVVLGLLILQNEVTRHVRSSQSHPICHQKLCAKASEVQSSEASSLNMLVKPSCTQVLPSTALLRCLTLSHIDKHRGHFTCCLGNLN